MRQNTLALSMSLKITEITAFERNVEAGNRIREIFIMNPHVSELHVRGMKSYADLGGSEKLRFGMVLSNIFPRCKGVTSDS